MSGIEGLRVITLDNVPINVILENMPKPIRVTGFDTSKKQDIPSNKDNKNTKKPAVFTFSPKTKVE